MKATFLKSVTTEAYVPWRGVWSVHFGEPEDEGAEHISWLSKILLCFTELNKYKKMEIACRIHVIFVSVCVRAHLDLFENPKGIEAKTK